MDNSRTTRDDPAAAQGAVKTAGVMESGTRLEISDEDIQKIVESRHDAPHRVLGPHALDDGSSTSIRVFLPWAERVSVQIKGPNGRACAMRQIHTEGLFEVTIERSSQDLDYEILAIDAHGEDVLLDDPYLFADAVFSREDEEQFVRGEHSRLFERFGAHPRAKRGIQGVCFAVWAPNAQRVSVVGPFNHWDGRCHPMRRRAASGVWEIFLPGVSEGALYKYEIKTSSGNVFLKSDPFAGQTEAYPDTASIVGTLDEKPSWEDAAWMGGEREATLIRRGISIYNMPRDALYRLGTAVNGPNAEPASQMNALIAEAKQAGFTHIELPLSPPGYWGSASYFAPGPATGLSTDLIRFIDRCHHQGIGVIMPAFSSRFPEGLDELAWFDGTPLYEEETTQAAGNQAFDLDKGEVRSILVSNARYWLERYHADGLRTDRAGALLYRDLLRQDRTTFAGVRVVVRESLEPPGVMQADMVRVLQGRHHDPFSILGPHYSEASQTLTIRAMALDAEQVYALLEDESEFVHPLHQIHEDGLFETSIQQAKPEGGYRLRVIERGGRALEYVDAYAFTDFSFCDLDQHLFASGNHYRIFEKLGAHAQIHGQVSGVRFSVWAPNAEGVSVVGSFNQWEGRRHPMKRHGDSGVWEIFVPAVAPGALYKYEIKAQNGHTFVKSDPYAFFAEVPPGTASVVQQLHDVHAWGDQDWLNAREKSNHWAEPLAVYEVHLGSWMRDEENQALTYRELATKLIPYVKDLGFTHIELLPIAEHPYEPSWGYQVSHFFAPTSRFGTPEDLMALVDACHQSGIGVILDWVPGHFPKDAHALAWFDGTSLYEHADPRRGEHRDWGTLIFNYGRHEVENFLIANALFWLETYHFDGLRVDAVASMLYLDYSRPSGEWLPNIHGGNENLEAIEFIKHTNNIVHERFPGVMMIAEESTAWPKVSAPTDHGGLGFGFKWNMGWMHDTLAYMSTPTATRKHHHNKLTFGIHYAFNENFVLSLSHDEVVHLKCSLLEKMPGDEWEKFANLRLLFTYMYAHPGKKLLFMGGEFGQKSEWSHATSLSWQLLERDAHSRLNGFVKDLNQLYRSERAFYEADAQHVGFEWLDVDSAEQCVLAFLRKARDPRNTLMFAFNFSAIPQPGYRIGVPFPVLYSALFNSGAHKYSGFGSDAPQGDVMAEEVPWHGHAYSIVVSLPPLCAFVFKPAAPEIAPNMPAGQNARDT